MTGDLHVADPQHFWRTWTPANWIAGIVVLVAVTLLNDALPMWLNIVAGFGAYAAWFVVVGRMRSRPRIPEQEWTPPKPSPGSES